MMINNRLIGTVKQSKRYIAGNVICQWVSPAANIVMMAMIAHLLQQLYDGSAGGKQIDLTAGVAVITVVIRYICAKLASRMSYLSAKTVKKTLREMIYSKLLRQKRKSLSNSRRAMRSEQEVNRAIDLYADTVRRICILYLKNSFDTESGLCYNNYADACRHKSRSDGCGQKCPRKVRAPQGRIAANGRRG